ncbi:IS3 family transposase [Marinisporobacter balticus]|uniref:Transposase InsO family protein n=1 Tax=Marinisporobacter balticus TaxID=2018667 RepID=A0A4R2KDY4_9FIRM|nr:IS3 family transposase [Marinisporobacter balticus]TCO68098.1 transposase InsO family protein [Marinisporobacter balticus]
MTDSNKKRKRRTYTHEFKNQFVQLYLNDKQKCDIVREYDISASLLDKWIKQSENTGSFKKKDNRTPEEQELIALRKRNKNVAVSDLTYVSVGTNWHYICILIDLFNREIIGYSAGRNKDASLVAKAFSKVNTNLENIQVFHTDRGNEFKNQLIDETLETFHIKRSLSMKGCPYDNAVADATFKIIKTEFVKGQTFERLDDLKYQLADYVNWFNNYRIHSSLGYLIPYQYRITNLTIQFTYIVHISRFYKFVNMV